MTNYQKNKLKSLLGSKELNDKIKKLNIKDADRFITYLEAKKQIKLELNDLDGTEIFKKWLSES